MIETLVFAMSILATAAAPPPPVNVRGAVTELTATRIVVQPPSGPAWTLRLAPEWSVQVMRPMALTAAPAGRFAGVITAPSDPGRAVEVHVFSAGVRMGEGPLPWDRPPGATLAQGDVVTVQGGAAPSIELRYGGTAHRFEVAKEAPVVMILNEGRENIKVGVQVFILGWPEADGGLRADAVATGEGGALPPL